MSLYIYDDSEFVTDEPYVFDVGEVLDISNIVINDDDETISFVIDSIQDEENEACCDDYAFYTCFFELDTNGAWFMFKEHIDEDCYTTENAYTFEAVQTYSPTELMYLSNIKYLRDEDLLSGFDEKGREVVVPRCAVVFHSYR